MNYNYLYILLLLYNYYNNYIFIFIIFFYNIKKIMELIEIQSKYDMNSTYFNK